MKTLSVTMEEGLLKSLDQGIRDLKLAGRSEAIREAVRDWVQKRALRKKVQRELAGYQKKPVDPKEFDPFISAQEFDL